MLKKLQARLTYANVMSTLAVFLAVGGGLAFALDRNSVKSRHIAPNEVKAADTSDKLRLECPGGTRYHEGTCIETGARATEVEAVWDDALSDCRDEGRRLPTPAELSSFRLEPGITLAGAGVGEWTLERDEDSLNAMLVTEAGILNSAGWALTFPYRCVARPKL